MAENPQQYFMGIPIVTEKQINDMRESQESTIYTVIRIVDANPTLGSPQLKARRTRTPCEGCREICWLDPKSFDSLRGANLRILCIQCTRDAVKEEDRANE